MKQENQHGNDLQNLRIEKRGIIEEEKRLRALLKLEKSNESHRKLDRQAAIIAEKLSLPKGEQ